MRDTENNSIYTTLQQLPLLRGASRERLAEIVGHMKLDFFKAAAGERIIAAGDACVSLVFVISGSVRLCMEGGNGDFKISQTLEGPQLISADCLFGYDTSYPCDVTALTPVSLMQISKEDFRRMLAMDPVFLFNYLNSVCTGSQRGRHGLMSIAGGSATERLAYWITTLTQPSATDILIKSGVREIHTVLGIDDAALSSAVEQLAPRVYAPDSFTLEVSDRDSLLAIL